MNTTHTLTSAEKLDALLSAAQAEQIPPQGKHPCVTFKTGYCHLTTTIKRDPYFLIGDYSTAKRLAFKTACLIGLKGTVYTCPHEWGYYVEII